MKKNAKIVLLTLLSFITLSSIVLSSCQKEKKKGCTAASALNYDATAEEDCYCCTYNGKAVFWNHPDDEYCEVKVWVDGVYIGTITSDYSSAPTCGTQGCVTYTAKPGTYNVVAIEEDCDGDSYYEEWNGSVTITSNGCWAERLQ